MRLLIETENVCQTEAALHVDTVMMMGIPVSVTPHNKLNLSKGVIHSYECHNSTVREVS